MMMSMRRKSRALLIKNPMPLSALICSATISVSHAMANDCRSPTNTCGAALGSMMMRSRCHNEKPRTSAVSNNLGVDLPDGGEGVEVQRESDPERDEIDLGQFADAEPENEQRNQPQVRQRAQHLQPRERR